ncbi:ABC transporter substrate-binding protein [Aquabacterium humicola]|uniref:ABC transporter substrate-binding protein n=1 Tax=Aquabacterium humicola TaxID=3237377 RepID=UPI002542CB2C|nr:ABC transporter substrate-binding protein [Rubrivivax pictus]
MRRRAAVRHCIASGIGTLAWPLAAVAQRLERKVVIGLLSQSTRYAPLVEDLHRQLREVGRTEGFTVEIEERWADDQWQALPKLALELVARQVDLIIANGDTPTVSAAAGATRTIPIVFLWVSDPVGQGLIRSLRQPGGNITGLSILGPELELKRLALLKEVVPKVTHVAVITNRAAADLAAPLRLLQSASASLGLQLSVFDVRERNQLAGVLDQVATANVHGLLVQDDYMLNLLVGQVAAFALKQRLPLVAENLSEGVLVAYRFDWDEQFIRAARLVGRILKGAHPGDLPVEQPTRFELMINLRTARALGITVPNAVLLRADRVLE